ncbi:alpha/beta hydrolase [Dysosmobacter sp.]|uniref:alpha/beta hydrolase n=1 Tax=Dysosmobacter sp. TaxID=2591382 RepID=UPI002A906BFE|nr:alpha/beta hydrolase [Dysosmobacter sp.]MDY3984645.1 alpha/beta hydrolase [Dysosmobacter sp.]
MDKPKKHKILKVIGLILGILLALGGGSYFYVTSHTQIVVGAIQKGMYGDGSPNSFEPLYTPGEGITAAGQYKINDIAYGAEYPNSFLDITYPDSNTETDRPTLFYFHGGGFFGGSKNMGDPMAANEATALLDDLCAQGYNIVNVDYALVPDHHFPVPLIQINDAIRFIADHKDEYHINTDSIILMGSSAGAIMTAQYGTVLSNPAYAALLGIEPALNLEQVSAVVIDDAPIDYGNMVLGCKMLIGNYVKGSIYLNEDELNRYECIPHMTSDYPAAFLLGSEYRNDMIAMSEKLKEADVEHILVDPFAEHGEIKPHCFVANERVDPVATEAFNRLTEFLKEETK